ncbi:MAG: YihY/virulence factor BrkB family protein [Solirubrobacteraceae bacterium]|nr:YihY/virulence factor BrkB family protein [Solirubrobacteraceae bacterium]
MKLLHQIAEELRAVSWREAVGEVTRAFRERDLLTFSSAIAFQVFYAIIPLVLFGLGVLGGLGLDEQWTQEWAPSAREAMSQPAFQVVDDTIRNVLGGQQAFWILAGAALAIWKVSATMRAIMDVFDRIYESRRERTFAERMRDSLALGAVVAALLLTAAGCAVLGDELLRGAGIDAGLLLWLRWPLALALLFVVVTLLVAYAPADHQPPQWVGFGSIVVVTAWVGTSLVFGIYLTSLADYGSIFGALATIVVALTYLYLAASAVLVGAQLDALVRERVRNGRSGTTVQA